MRLLVHSVKNTTAFLSSQQRLSPTLLCFRRASSMLSLRLTFLTLGVYTLSAVKAFCLLQSRGLGPASASFLALQNGGKTTLRRRCSVAMQVNPREDADFEMTVDWDEELRKLNAAQYTKKRAERAKKEAEPDVMKWAKTSTRKAQSAAQETSFKVRGAMNDSPRWRQLSQDYRFWLGLVAGISLLASILSATSRNQDLVVWNDALGEGTDGDVYTLAYAAFVAAQTAHVAGDTAAQLAETGATMVFA